VVQCISKNEQWNFDQKCLVVHVGRYLAKYGLSVSLFPPRAFARNRGGEKSVILLLRRGCISSSEIHFAFHTHFLGLNDTRPFISTNVQTQIESDLLVVTHAFSVIWVEFGGWVYHPPIRTKRRRF